MFKYHLLLSPMAIATIMFANPSPAFAAGDESRSISLPSLSLDKALQEIAKRTGTIIHYDPDAVPGKMSAPVTRAKTAKAAVRQALRGANLGVTAASDGALTVGNDIVVIARRDEAETSLLVKQTSSSSRNGESLREQARTTTVISSKLMVDQQAQDIGDVLKNAGGVTVVVSPQGGNTFSIRGFASNGVVNGLSGNTFTRFGETEPVANLERVEVLKGPDAILIGADNLGGTINLVTKKPTVDPILSLALETGSYGSKKITVDASNALNDAKTLSARFVAEARADDRNFGGYRGTREALFAPSLRFKNGDTDIVAGLSTTEQSSGIPPFALVGENPLHVVVIPDGPVGPKDQGIAVHNDLYYLTATQKITDWLTVVGRGQIQRQDVVLSQYTLLGFADPMDPSAGVAYSGDREEQESNTRSVDGYARLTFSTFGATHKLVLGGSYSSSRTSDFTSSASTFDFLDVFDPPALAALPSSSDLYNYTLRQAQTGFYAQDLVEIGDLHLSAGVRHNRFTSSIAIPGTPPAADPTDKGYSPSFGIVYDVDKHVSIYANYVKGFEPSLSLKSDLTTLPSSKTENIEAGIKATLFNNRVEFVGSFFRIRQSNRAITDPADPIYSIGAGGTEGKGVDLDLRGTILPGWSVQAAFTYTDYTLLQTTEFETVVTALPAVKFSLYTGYEKSFGKRMSAGGSVGVSGQSSSYGDPLGAYRVPASRSVDANLYFTVGGLRVNAGMKNLFDRRNYDVTSSAFYLPRMQTRNWRLTATYNFF